MSIAATRAENRVLLSNVSWATYEALVAETESRGTRFTYDRGYLEIMSPSAQHEWFHRLIGRLVEAFTEELGIPIRSGGATTLKGQLKDRGLEPDECYYVANESQIRGKKDIDLLFDPPPDLAIEIDVSRNSLDKLAIYGVLGVPEVWVYDEPALQVYVRNEDGTYAKRPASLALPDLPVEVIESFLDRCSESDETTWIGSFRKWVRSIGLGIHPMILGPAKQ